MDNQSTSTTTNTTNDSFSNKNTIIIVLFGLLAFSFLGINLVTIMDHIIQYFVKVFGPLVSQILSVIGNTTGTVINESTDVVTNTAKTGIDIAGGTFHDIGDLLKKGSEPGVKNAHDTIKHLDQSIKNSNFKKHYANPDTAENPIQKPISSAKTNWCLVGEYQGRRGCIEISEHDKCLSGQVFPEQKLCLNPTMTNNMNPKPMNKQ